MSSEPLLSRDEMDALLAELGGGPGASALAAPGEAESYDFASPTAVIRSLSPQLEALHQRFGEALRAGLAELLRCDLEVEAESPEACPLPTFLASLSNPCSITQLRLDPLPGQSFLAIDRELLFAVVDAFFGGPRRLPLPDQARAFTDTELRMVQRVRPVALRAIEEVWREVQPGLSCSVLREDHNPSFVKRPGARDLVVVGQVLIRVGECQGRVRTALPARSLEPLRLKLLNGPAGDGAQDPAYTRRWRSAIESSPVSLRCSLVAVELAVRELLALRAGDVIPIELPKSVQVEVEGVPFFRGRYGAHEGRRAVKVEQLLRAAGESR
jgi:flagellar motor switch protein FliM